MCKVDLRNKFFCGFTQYSVRTVSIVKSFGLSCFLNFCILSYRSAYVYISFCYFMYSKFPNIHSGLICLSGERRAGTLLRRS